MDLIMNNPKLEHIGQNIFMKLDNQSLLHCRYVSQSWRTFLDNPRFWLKRIQNYLTKEHFTEWDLLIQKMDHDWKMKQTITLCLYQMNEDCSRLFPSWLCKKSCYWFEDDDKDEDIYEDENEFEDDSEDESDDEELEDDIIETKIECDNLHFSQSPLQVASAVGAIDLVFFILAYEISSITKDNHGYTPIHIAALYGHTNVVRTLLLHTDNPNAPNNHGVTPIHLAAMNGHADVVRALFRHTKNPNAQDNFGVTPFLLAVWNNEYIDAHSICDSLDIDQEALKILEIDR